MTSPTECQHHEGFFRADFLLCCQTVCRRVLAFSHMAVRTDSSTPRSIKHANGFSLFTRCLKFFTSSANPPQMATQAAANKRQGPGVQCYHGLVLLSSISTDKAELFAETYLTHFCFTQQISACVIVTFFLGIFSYFSCYLSPLLFCRPSDQNRPDPTQFPRTGLWICSWQRAGPWAHIQP